MLILGTVKNYGKRYGQPKLLAHEDRLIHFLQNPDFAFFISIEIMCLYCFNFSFHLPHYHAGNKTQTLSICQ